MITQQNRVRPLRAGGRLNFAQFVELIETLWTEVTGGQIPFLASGLETEAEYPCITYRVANKVNDRNESRPRLREIMRGALGSETPFVYGQRQAYHIQFTVSDRVSTSGALNTESLIERFEDFMTEHTPILMWKGAADVDFERRLQDNHGERNTEDVLTKTIVYKVVLEKEITIDRKNLERVAISISDKGTGDTFDVDGG